MLPLPLTLADGVVGAVEIGAGLLLGAEAAMAEDERGSIGASGIVDLWWPRAGQVRGD